MSRYLARELGVLAGALALLALAALGIQRLLFPSPWPAPDLPRQLDDALAPLMRQQVRATQRVVDAPEVSADVSAILVRLIEAVPPSLRPGPGGPPGIEVLVIRSSQINAFTLPGGLICVDTGLLRSLDSVEELAGVLGHEISHVVRRDPLNLLAARLGITALMSVLGARSGAAVVQSMITELVDARYGRGAEDQADRFSVDLLARAALDPGAFARALSRIRDAATRSPDLLKYFDPHSPIDQRIGRAEDQARREKAAPRPLGVDWTKLIEALPED